MCSQLVVVCLLVTLLAACARDSLKDSDTGRQIDQQTATPKITAAPYEQIGPMEDISYSGMQSPPMRLIIRIAIPHGHTQEEVSETLKRVAETTAQAEGASEVLVFVYRSKADISEAYNVGRAAWKRATNIEPLQLAVDLDSNYFTAEQVSTPLGQGDRGNVGGSRASGVTLVRETYGDKWPFPKYASAILDCETKVFRGVLRPLTTIELGGTRYGFNTTAVEVGGFPDARPLIVNFDFSPIEMGVLSQLREKGLDICIGILNIPPNPVGRADGGAAAHLRPVMREDRQSVT